MDGSSADRFLQGRHISPVSTHFAVTVLPGWIYSLMTYNQGVSSVHVNVSSNSLGNDIIYMQRNIGTGPENQLWLLNSDYKLCIEIVNTIPLQLFPAESVASIMKRITGAIRVKFEGRPGF